MCSCTCECTTLQNVCNYLQTTGVGAQGAGQQLESPGSCLTQFRTQPFVECNAKAICHFYQDDLSFWMVSIDGLPMERTDAAGALDRVSRCRVCRKP